jgi:thioesterase domain-containing protein
MELENLIGMFVNTLVRRTRVSSDVSFDDLLAQVREDTMLDLEHQHVPLDMVVQRLNPPRSPAYQPLYQIMFAYQHVPPNLIDLDGVDVELTVAPEQDAQAELMLDVFDWDSRLELRWNYHPQLFGRTTIEALADDFERVLRRALTAPATPVGQMAATSQGLLRLRRHPGSAVPVFALPGILGLGASFAQLSAFVDDRTLYALPVRDLHRRGIDPGARELAASCADLIAEVTDADGVHLAGHSFGGTLNLYVARALQERGIPVRSIVLLDSNVPDVVRRRLSGTRRERLVRFLSILADTLPGLRRRAPDDLAVRLRDTPEDEILIQTRALITQEERDLLGDDLHAVFAAYVAMSALDWPAFTPPEDVPVLLIEAASGRMPDEDPAGDWSRLLGDRLRLDAVDADHESMLRHPHVRDVAAKMGRFLAEHEGRP